MKWRDLAPPESTDIVLVIPLLVIDELDRAKHGSRRSAAGHTLAYLQGLLESQTGGGALPGGRADGVGMQVFFDDPGHVRLGRADDELVEQSLAVRALSSDEHGRVAALTVLTFDGGMAARARRVGLSARLFAQPVKAWDRAR